MKTNIFRKGFVLGVILVIFAASFIAPMCIGLNVDKNVDSRDKVYKVAVGPPGCKNMDECKVIMNLSEEEALEIKELFLAIGNSNTLSSEEILEQEIEILREYGIFPPEFTVENLTKLFKENFNDRLLKFNFSSLGVTIGLHFIFYCSVLSTWQPLFVFSEIFFYDDVSNICDIINCSEEFKDILESMYLSSYGGFHFLHICLAPTPLYYMSIPLLSISPSLTYDTSFIGIYQSFFAAGIYIFRGGGPQDIPSPIIDIVYGFSLNSIVIPLKRG